MDSPTNIEAKGGGDEHFMQTSLDSTRQRPSLATGRHGDTGSGQATTATFMQQITYQQNYQQMAMQGHQQLHQPPWQPQQIVAPRQTTSAVVNAATVQQGLSLASNPSVVSAPQQPMPIASYGDNQQQVVPLPQPQLIQPLLGIPCNMSETNQLSQHGTATGQVTEHMLYAQFAPDRQETGRYTSQQQVQTINPYLIHIPAMNTHTNLNAAQGFSEPTRGVTFEHEGGFAASRDTNECEIKSRTSHTPFDCEASHACSPGAFPGTSRSPIPSFQDTTNLESHEMSLKEWIKGAIYTVSKREGISLESAATSPTYLKGALRVAYMLADQLCTTEGGGPGIRDTNSEVTRRDGMAWIKKVSVFTKKCNRERGNDDAKDPNRGVSDFMNDLVASFGSHDQPEEDFDASDRSDADELIARLMGSCDSTRGDQLTDPNDSEERLDYLTMTAATFPLKGRQDHGEDMTILYNLGLHFLELFSGGSQRIREIVAIDINTALDAIGIFEDNGNEMKASRNSTDLGPNKKPRDSEGGPEGERGPSSTSASAVQSLRGMGVPNSLCDLVGDMIDTINGDFCSRDTYAFIWDVRDDIELLIDNPEYLENINVEEACRHGLRISERLWACRNDELKSLLEMYSSFPNRPKSQASIIYGCGGIGKTALVRDFLKQIDANTCVLLSGKFEKNDHTKPYSAIASALDRYCLWITQHGEAPFIQNLRSSLQDAFGKDASALLQHIPSLSSLIEDQGSLRDTEHSCLDPQKKLQYLFGLFVRAIASVSSITLILYLENLQYLDAESSSLMKNLLLDNPNVFLLGCCRDDQMESKHPLRTMLKEVKSFGVKHHLIRLESLPQTTVNTFISKQLHLLPRKTRALARILHQKSGGNPFFLCVLLDDLNREGLISVSLSKCCWAWDLQKIRARDLADDVVEYLSASLDRLPGDVLSALCTLSCFGSSSDRSLDVLQTELELPLTKNLDKAVEECLLMKDENGTYSFSSERLKDAAYSRMKCEDRCLHHFNYGLTLAAAALKNEDDTLLLIAVSQINFGGVESVSGDDEAVTVARYNLRAGRKATALSDYSSAYWFYDHGIDFLKPGHWKRNYELSLALFVGAAESALAVGEYDVVSILSEQVMHYANKFEDKMPIFYVTIRLLMLRMKYSECIKCSMDVLNQLNEYLPIECKEDDMASIQRDTEDLLQGMEDDDLLDYRCMRNDKKMFAMKVLAKICEPLIVTQAGTYPIVVMKMVELSVKFGFCSFTSFAFVNYGCFIASTGSIREGFRYSKIGLALMARFGNKAAGEVFAYSTQLKAYIEPVQSSIEFHKEGERTSMISGNPTYSIMNRLLYDSCGFWAGKRLKGLLQSLEQTISLAQQHKQFTVLVQLLPLVETVVLMIGGSPGQRMPSQGSISSDASFVTDELQQSLRKDSEFQTRAYLFNKMFTSFMMRDLQEMVAYAEKFEKLYGLHKRKSGLFLYSGSVQTFYDGLVSYWAFRKIEDSEARRRWLSRAKQATLSIEKLETNANPWNFENKRLLLKAELAFCERNNNQASTLYNLSISSSEVHHFPCETALANMLAGHFHHTIGNNPTALRHFLEAKRHYSEWEAFGMVQQIDIVLENLRLNESS